MCGRRDVGTSRRIAGLLCLGCMLLGSPLAGEAAQQKAESLLPSPEAPPDLSPAAAADYFADYEQARTLYDAGRWSEAAPLLDGLTATYAGDAELWFALARVRERLGRGPGAIEAYRAALGLGFRFEQYLAHRVARLHAERVGTSSGAADSAFAWLERALAAGYGDRPGLVDDPAFAALRDDPRAPGLTGRQSEESTTRIEGWRTDIDYLVEEARRLHPDPDRPAFSATFDSAAADLRARVPETTDDQMLVELSRLVTLLGDGHSGIYGPGPDSPLELSSGDLPVLFYLFSDGLHIVNGAGDAARWIGTRVLRFGDRSAEAVLDELDDYVHHDNAATHRWIGVHFALRRTAILQALGATDDPSRVTLTLRDSDGVEREVTFSIDAHRFPRKLRPPTGPRAASDDPPLYLKDVDRNYWLRPLPEANAIYWQFNQVRELEGGPTVSEFADTLRAALEETGAQHLVVDVRHNNGGNNGLLRPLVRTLVWWEQAAPERRIFVIMGRNTFSAAQNFLNRVERWTDAVFVGEPSSSRPNFTGEETELLLPWSRVRGSISNRYWQDSDPLDERQWIAPQIPIGLSSDDYFSNRDPALEAVREVIGRASS